MSRPVLVLAGRQRPHELCLLVASVYLGALNLLHPSPGTPITLLPAPVRYGCLVALLLSGLVGLAGCFWAWHVERGLRIEQAGMLIGAGALLILVAAIFSVAGWRLGLISTPTTIAWVAANLWRAGQIHLELRRMRRGGPP